MATYQSFTSLRTTDPDIATMTEALRSQIDPTCGIQVRDVSHYTVKRNGAIRWTDPELATAQQIVDTSTERSTVLSQQRAFDTASLAPRAQGLVLLDYVNAIRQRLTMPPITEQQYHSDVKAKIGVLGS